MASSVERLRYFDATVQYRSEQLKNVEATFLNKSIPFQLFITLYPEKVLSNIERNNRLLKELIRSAQNRYRCPMRYAFCHETFPFSREVRTHVAIAADVELDIERFKNYFLYRPVNITVLPYRDAIAYMMKQTNVQLVNCDPFLKPPATSRERRREKRMKERSSA
jgi:hypothetical protein